MDPNLRLAREVAQEIPTLIKRHPMHFLGYFVGTPVAASVLFLAFLFSCATPAPRSGRLLVFLPASAGTNSIRWQGIEVDGKLPLAVIDDSVVVVPQPLLEKARENQGRVCTFTTQNAETESLPTLQMLRCKPSLSETLPTTGV